MTTTKRTTKRVTPRPQTDDIDITAPRRSGSTASTSSDDILAALLRGEMTLTSGQIRYELSEIEDILAALDEIDPERAREARQEVEEWLSGSAEEMVSIIESLNPERGQEARELLGELVPVEADTPSPALALDLTINPQTGRKIGEDWIASLSSPRTAEGYKKDLQTFCQWCEDHEVWPITAARGDVDQFLKDQAELWGAGTVARRLSALRSFFQYSIDAELITADPTARIKPPRVDSTRQNLTRARTAEEMGRVLAAARANPRDYALVAVLIDTGARISEVVGLDIGAVKLDGGKFVIDVKRKGGGRDRVLATSRVVEAIEQLETHLAEVDGRTRGPLFASNGKRWSRQLANQAVGRLGRRAGLDGRLSPHQFRATGITLLLDKGHPLHRVQQWAGHSDPVTTQRYNRSRDSLEHSPAPALMNIIR